MKYLFQKGWLVAILLLSLVSRSGIAKEPDKTNLTPVQRKQIQIVSQAILASKRSVEPSTESLVIRKQLKRVKAHLDALAAPVGTVRLRLETNQKSLASAPKTAKSIAAFSAEDKHHVWKQARSKSIKKLDRALTELKTLCEDEVQKRESLQSALKPSQSSLLQRLKTKFFKVQADQTASLNQNPVVTSLSNAALTRLDDLQTEINDTLALPEQERQQKLLALSKRLHISQQPPVFTGNDQDDNETAPLNVRTPTLVSRTSHRRQF